MPNEYFFEWFFNSELFLSAKETGAHKIWGFYDYLRDEACRLATSRYRYWRLRRIFDAGRRLTVMKIGPSTGSMLYMVQRHGHEAIGCDISSTFISYAREHYDVRIDHGRFERLPYEAGAFDVILLFNVIENVPNLTEFLTSIHSRLRPGGYFVCQGPSSFPQLGDTQFPAPVHSGVRRLWGGDASIVRRGWARAAPVEARRAGAGAA